MVYDVKKIINDGFTIVYGLSDSEITEIEQQLYRENPKLRTKITDMFFPKSIGPFKFEVKKSVKELLMSDRIMKEMGVSFLESHAKKLDCEYILDRKPKNLSWGQRFRLSLILDCVHNKTDYLFKDNNDYSGAVNAGLYIPVSEWIMTDGEYVPAYYYIIWLTSAKEEDFLQLLADSNLILQENCTFITTEDGHLVHKKDLLKEFKAEKSAWEAARLEKEEEQQAKIEKAQTVRRQVQEKTEARLEEKTDKPENIVLIEELIFECSMVPLAPHRLEGLMELLKEAASVEHYEQFIEVIKMYLMACEDIYGEADIIYEDALETCEKEREALLSAAQ